MAAPRGREQKLPNLSLMSYFRPFADQTEYSILIDDYVNTELLIKT